MAGNIIVRIALEGAQKIKAELQGIGEAGRRAFDELSKAQAASDKAAPLAAGISKAAAAFKEVTGEGGRARLAAEQFGGALRTIPTAITLGTTALVTFGTAATAAFIALTKGAVDSRNALREIALSAKTSTAAVQSLKFAFAQAGVGADGFKSAFGEFSKAFDTLGKNPVFKSIQRDLAETGVAVRSAKNDFGQLAVASEDGTRSFDVGGKIIRVYGGEVKKLGGELSEGEKFLIKYKAAVDDLGRQLTPEESFKRLTNALRAIPDSATKSQEILTAFGKEAGAALIDFFSSVNPTLEQTRARFDALGISLTSLDERNLRGAAIGFETFGTTLEAVRTKIGAIVAPAVTEFFGVLQKALEDNIGTFTRFAEVAGNFAVQALRDFIALASGDRSAVSSQWVLDLADGFEKLRTIVTSTASALGTAVTTISTVLGKVAEAVNAVFGSDFTGAEVGVALLVARWTGALNLIIAAVKVAGSLILGVFGIQGLVIVGVVAAFAGLVALIVANWDTIKSTASETATAVVDFFKGIGERIGSFFSGIGEKLAEAILSALKSVSDFLGGIISSAESFLGRLFDRVREIASTIASAVTPGAANAATPGAPGAAAGGVDFSLTSQQLALVRQDGEAAFAALTVAGETSAQAIATAFGGLVTAAGAALAGLRDAAITVFEEIGATASTAVALILDALNQLAGGDPFSPLAEVARQAFDSIRANVAGLGEAIASAISGGVERAVGAVRSALADITAAVQAAIQQLDALIARAQEAAAAAQAAASAGGGGGGGNDFAGGGLVRGPGTETSDSIPAWLSNNEFVLRGAAVRRYGLGLLYALNSLRVPVERVRQFSGGGFASRASRDGLPRFATGGFVGQVSSLVSSLFSIPVMGSAVPASASAATPQQSQEMRPVVLNIGGGSFGPMLAPAEVAAKLERFAAGAQIRMAGARPSWGS